MTPQELKNSILQMAFQGRLVKQDCFETVDNSIPFITDTGDDELIGSIPDSWKIVKLIDVADVLYGYPFDSQLFNELYEGKPLIRIRDVSPGFSKTYTTEACDSKYNIRIGDMLVGMDGNFQVEFWKSQDAWLNQRVCKITARSVLSQRFLYYYLPIALKAINETVSYSTVKHLSAKILNSLYLPYPPLAEQHRIVAKIESLLPLIDRYEKAWTRLEDFNKRFPGDMQKSILQMAIQGKLVEQCPEEGTGEELYQQIQQEKARLVKEGKIKKEKPLPEIAEDEVPFEVPETWKWVRLGKITTKITDGTHKTPKYTETGIRFVSAKDIVSGQLSFEQCRHITQEEHAMLYTRCNPERGDLLISKSGSIGTVVEVDVDYEFSLFESLALVKHSHCLLFTPYLRYAIQNAFTYLTDENIRGVAVKHLPIDSITTMKIPLPPFSEQKRIVTRLEELLPLCERLK